MSRPLRLVVANDNAPLVSARRNAHGAAASIVSLTPTAPLPDTYLSAPDWVDQDATANYSTAVFDTPNGPIIRERLGAALGLWTLVFGALAVLLPDLLPAPVIIGGAVAGALTALAILSRSRIVLGLAALAIGIAAVTATELAPMPSAAAFWATGFSSLLALQVVIALCQRHPLAAGAIAGLAVIWTGACMILLDVSLALDPLWLAPLALTALGLARAAVRADMTGATTAYFITWTICVVGGLALTQFGLPDGAIAVPSIVTVLAAIALAIWSMQGLHAAIQAAMILAIGTLWVSPDAVDALTDVLGAFENQPFAQLLTAAAVLSAGAALTIRGILNGKRLAMLTGALAILAQGLVILNANIIDIDNSVLLCVALSAMVAWLLSARIN